MPQALGFWDDDAVKLFAEVWLGETFKIVNRRARITDNDCGTVLRVQKGIPCFRSDGPQDRVMEFLHWLAHWRRWRNKTQWSQVAADIQMRFTFQPSQIMWAASHNQRFRERLIVCRRAWERFVTDEPAGLSACRSPAQAARYLTARGIFLGLNLPLFNSDSTIGEA